MKVLFEAFFYLHVTRETLLKRLSYQKVAHKMFMKLTQGCLDSSFNGGFLQSEAELVDSCNLCIGP